MNGQEVDSGVVIAVLLFSTLIWVLVAYWAGAVARNKGRSFGGFFVLGLFLGLIGVLVAYLVGPGYAHPPPRTPRQTYPPPLGPLPQPPGSVMYCQSCGASVGDTADFCPTCGARIGG